MVRFAELLHWLFPRALLAGLACGVTWRFVPPGATRRQLQWAGALLFFIPQLPVVFLLYRSMALLVYGEATLAAWMLGVSALTAWRLWQRWHGRDDAPRALAWARWRATGEEIAVQARARQVIAAQRRTQSSAVLVVIVLLMGGFGAYLGWAAVADAFLPRMVVEGPVERIRTHYGRAPRLFDIVVGGRQYHVTHDVAARLRSGDDILAEVGAGSHTFLAMRKRLPHGEPEPAQE